MAGKEGQRRACRAWCWHFAQDGRVARNTETAREPVRQSYKDTSRVADAGGGFATSLLFVLWDLAGRAGSDSNTFMCFEVCCIVVDSAHHGRSQGCRHDGIRTLWALARKGAAYGCAGKRHRSSKGRSGRYRVFNN